MSEEIFDRLRRGLTTVWFNPQPAPRARATPESVSCDDVADALARWHRFRVPLRQALGLPDWDGVIQSPLQPYLKPPSGLPALWVKADHELPVTGTVKSRGGIYEVLCFLERIALQHGLISTARADDASCDGLNTALARAVFGRYTVIVASTGNLGFSIGLVATAFGLNAEIHMSTDAKEWKKQRLRALGARVIEHMSDYTGTIAAARATLPRPNSHFVDDESSRELFLGYTAAGTELAAQLAEAQLTISAQQPLFVYLPCGVGGAPGGIAYGLKALYGERLACIFVEPTASACMLVALAATTPQPVSVYDVGLTNRTEADGLAVGRASEFVIRSVGRDIDAVIAVTDSAMIRWVGRAWHESGLRLEVSAAAGFAAIDPLRAAVENMGSRGSLPPIFERFHDAVHVVWSTGGSQMPDGEFERLLAR